MTATPERIHTWTDYDLVMLQERVNDFVTTEVSNIIEFSIRHFSAKIIEKTNEGPQNIFYAYMRYIPQ